MTDFQRHRRRRLGLLALAGLGLAPLGANAQSLAEAVDAAWRRNPEARALDARRAELEARAQAASTLFAGPGAVSLSARSDRVDRDAGEAEYEAELGFPLWLPGQRAAAQGAAAAGGAELEARRHALRLDLAGRIVDAWAQVDMARGEQALELGREAAARALAEDARRRLGVGEISRFDFNLAEGERLTAETALADAQARLAAAEATLHAITGIARHGALPDVAAAGPSEESWRVVLARRAMDAAQARLALKRSAAREAPEFSVSARRERGERETPFANSVGFKVRVPFGGGPRWQAEVAAEQAEVDQTHAALAQAELAARLDLERARRELDLNQRSRQLAEERRTLAADNLELARRAYRLGELDLTSLLRVQSAALEAERAAEQARIGLSASRARLSLANGVLP